MITPLPNEIAVPRRTVARLRIDPQEWVGRRVEERETNELVEAPIIFQEAGLVPRTTIVYLHLKDYGVDLSPLAALLKQIDYSSLNRVGGAAAVPEARQRVFGYMPRKTGHRDYCTAASLAWDNRDAQEALSEAAGVAEHFYRLTNPVLYEAHRQQTKNKVLAQWHLGNDVFTSGIVNKNNPLPYHYDTGNFAQVWSAMYVFKSPGYSGGRLAVPEYDASFELPDHSLLMFDGQGLVHGVTPVLRGVGAVYRYSVVYYSLRMMWQCLTTWEEVERAALVKTVREQRRADASIVEEEEDATGDSRGEGLW